MKLHFLLLILAGLLQWGCSGAFWGGTAAGALAAGAGYEIQAKRQMDQLEEDRKNERISNNEYQVRKQQIESGSIIY
jgi:Tfp pilus assembly protein PilO